MKTTQEMIAVMQAELAGKTIQIAHVGRDDWTDMMLPSQWHWMEFDYRIHPKHDIAPGHNPDNLTVEQVGEGWRLLDENEIVEGPSLVEIEVWQMAADAWYKNFHGHLKDLTYRTKLSREALHKLRFPPKPPTTRRVPLGPADFPPGTLLRTNLNKKECLGLVTETNNRILVAFRTAYEYHCFTTDTYGHYTRSLDGGKTWLPCYKEILE